MSKTIPALLLVAALPMAALAAPNPGATTFTVRIENVSTPATLRLSDGTTAPAPNSPGAWVLQTKPGRLFEPGRPQRGWGLEAQAEDGDPSALVAHCMHHDGVRAAGAFSRPVGDTQPGPALPGKAYEFTVTARPGDRLAFTTMFGQSNDVFLAPEAKGIALFEKGRPVSGDVTSQVLLWDAGTEVNEEPGLGPNQAPRQPAPNTGPSETKPVTRLNDRFAWPRVQDVLRVTITPSQTAAN